MNTKVDKISSLHNEYHEVSDKYLQQYYLYKDKWEINFLNEILTEPYGSGNPFLRDKQIYFNYRPIEITPYLIQGTISRYSTTIYYDDNFKTDVQQLPFLISTLELTPIKKKIPDRHSWIVFQILNPDIALISLAYLDEFDIKINLDDNSQKIVGKLLTHYSNNESTAFNKKIEVLYKNFNNYFQSFRLKVIDNIKKINIKYCQPIITALGIHYQENLSYQDLIYIHYRSMDVSDHLTDSQVSIVSTFIPQEMKNITKGKFFRFIYNNILNQQILLLNLGIVYLVETRYTYSNDNDLMYASYDYNDEFTNDFKNARTTTISFTSKPFPYKSHNDYLDEYRQEIEQSKKDDIYNSISRLDHKHPNNIITTFPIPTLILAFIVYYKIKPSFVIALNCHHNENGNSMLILMHQNNL